MHGSLSGRNSAVTCGCRPLGISARVRGNSGGGVVCPSFRVLHLLSINKHQLVSLSGVHLLKCMTRASGLRLGVDTGDTDYDWLLSGSRVKSGSPCCCLKMLPKTLLLSLGILAPPLLEPCPEHLQHRAVVQAGAPAAAPKGSHVRSTVSTVALCHPPKQATCAAAESFKPWSECEIVPQSLN